MLLINAMKIFNQQRTLRFGLFILLVTSGYQAAFSQATPELTSFKILFETTNEGLRLTCQEGCSWKELKVSLRPNQAQAINQYGLTSVMEAPEAKNEIELDPFLITVKKSLEGLTFEGKKGTAWKNLDFGCPAAKCYQYVDEFGMTTEE